MSEFYKVQIPYRGVIPVINRRGPVPCAELLREQIEQLQDFGVELLNPDNGKPFEFPAEAKVIDVAVANPAGPVNVDLGGASGITVMDHPGDLKEPVTPAEPAETKDEDPAPTVPAADETPTANETAPTTESEPATGEPAAEEPTEEPAVEEPKTEETKADDVDDAKAKDAEKLGFDYQKIDIYSALSKAKKRAVRAKYVELFEAQKDTDTIYAELNAFAKT